jgi:hypothetical protein
LPPSTQDISIPFVSKVKKMDKVDAHKADKTELIQLEFLMDTGAQLQVPSTPVTAIFKDG